MSIYIYILVMAVTTYLIRALPLTVFRKPIKSRFLRSFLHYVPTACLTAMTFPAILYATENWISGAVGLGVGSCLVNKKWVDAGQFELITAEAKKFVENIKNA